MRFTLETWGDLDVADGVPLRDVRPHLARLTGDPRLADAVLGVAGRALGEDHPAGVPPWTTGARLEVGGGRPDEVEAAVRASWHVAVVAGPDAGRVAAPGRDRAVVVGRDEPGARHDDPAHGRLGLTDPALSERHVRLERSGGSWTVHDLGSRNGTAVLTATGRRRPAVRPRRRRAVAGDRVVLAGSTVLEVRTTPVPDGGPEDPRNGVARATAGPDLTRWVAPAAVGAVVAAVTGSLVFLLLALSGPLTWLLGHAHDRLRRRRRPPAEPSAPDPATVRLAAARGSSETPEPAWLARATDGLAVVGAPEQVRAVARALVGALLVARPEVRPVVDGAPDAWRALRWLGPVARARDRPVLDLTVLELTDDGPLTPVRARPAGDVALVLARSVAAVPAWCTTRVRCGPAGPDGSWPGAPEWWLDDVVRRVAARAPAGGRLPDHVGLAGLARVRSADDVLAAWRTAGTGLAATVARGADGDVLDLDLVRDGPHALVAGTTGSGKSELLQSLVLGLALRHPPDRLAVVLVDHKGGAGLAGCRDLPHVVGTVTDLEPGASRRALAGLRTELRRRERLLADAGVTDLAELWVRRPGDAPPRLLVVVDEFLALVDDEPDVVPGLVRLAAQGRSLGLHLVLATQRPAGAVTPQMRANLALRVCLRVADEADSLDVVGTPAAAQLPPGRPGRALVRRGPGAVETVQTAWAALPPPGVAEPVRWADRPAPPSGDHTAVLVDLVRQAADRSGVRLPEPPWLPPLPDRVALDALPAPHGGPEGTAGRLGSFALADRPDERRREVVRWDGVGGALLVVGGPRSGRTTTLRTLAACAGPDVDVHVVTGPDGRAGEVAVPEARLGTVVGPDDPRRLARLLDLLLTRPTDPPALLVVDDVGAAVRALERVGPQTAELVERVVRDGRHRGVAVAVAGSARETVRLVPHASARLVLSGTDGHDAVLLGLRRAPVGPPGRGSWCADGDEVEVQVALPPGAVGDHAAAPIARRATPRLAPIPRHLPAEDPRLVVAGSGAVALGLGGDHAGPVVVDAVDGVLVVGPPGSGRSSTVARIAAALDELGGTDVVVADDLDVTLRSDGGAEARLAARVTEGAVVVASVRTDTAASAFRGVVAELRATATVVVLDPSAPGSAQAAGADLTAAVDPTRRAPGWAAVVRRGRVVPVQVAAVSSGRCAPPRGGSP